MLVIPLSIPRLKPILHLPLVPAEGDYSNPKSFVNFLLPPQGIGEGWGGVKNLRLRQGLL